jgi:hypothetical protein
MNSLPLGQVDRPTILLVALLLATAAGGRSAVASSTAADSAPAATVEETSASTEDANGPSAAQRQKKQRTAIVGMGTVVGVVLAGLALIAVVMLLGGRTRRIARGVLSEDKESRAVRPPILTDRPPDASPAPDASATDTAAGPPVVRGAPEGETLVDSRDDTRERNRP